LRGGGFLYLLGHLRRGAAPLADTRVQHVRDEIAHVDGGTYRAIEEEEGSKERRQRIRLQLQFSQEPQRQQIARFAPGEQIPLATFYFRETMSTEDWRRYFSNL